MFNGTSCFAARDDVSGIELWKSNGTTAGAVMVRDIDPGILHSTPDESTVVDNLLLFDPTLDTGDAATQSPIDR